MRIDLHTHSSYSDGTSTPTELMCAAAEAHLDVMGISDHDTVAGWEEAANAVSCTGVSLVRGMECTTRYDGIDIHVLGILFDPADQAIRSHIAQMANSREIRARQIVDRLEQDFPVTWNDVVELAGDSRSVGRPHIADALVGRGVVENRSEAFERILHTSSPYYVPQIAPSTPEAIEMINNAGGRAILAHPKAVKRGKTVSDRTIELFAQAGLFGVEIDHRDNPVDARPALVKLAKRLGLARFGASDYHGAGKPNTLGEGVTDEAVYFSAINGTFLEVLHP
ncbi:PHP domain-containing protein [Arcanobacterium ihumii]|uniref:PHP domain-containing protein n=1 Tax=Arcanobacterium ihumii TaxID=2138162 RepID=UPI000F52A674|nr:PHP domain-containing protein [Arcanobacterium ihumii]